jgi:hypothetical protein
MKALAVIHTSTLTVDGTRVGLVTSAVDGASAHSVIVRDVETKGDTRGVVVEEFLRLWSQYAHQGMILYISDAVVRGLLQENPQRFPGLMLRSVVVGEGLKRAWRLCRQAHSAKTNELQPGKQQKTSRIVVATDASMQNRTTLAGISAVTTRGEIRMETVTAANISEGEGAALALALDTWGGHRFGLDIVTDNKHLYYVLNSPTYPLSNRNPKSYVVRARLLADKLRGYNLPIKVHWVRGHCDHPLHSLADRAAVIARRSAQWEQLAARRNFARRLKSELDELLAQVGDVSTFLPTKNGS